MELTVKITPRVAAQVARRLRLAASVRSRSMSAMVNDALDDALPSLEEIRMQLAAPAAPAVGESGLLAEIIASHPGPVTGIAARSGPAGPQALDGGTGDGSMR
jgi:plasmid stability protein